MTPAGQLTTLYSFCSNASENCPNGAYPTEGLVQGTDGSLYVTTSGGGGVTSDIAEQSRDCAGTMLRLLFRSKGYELPVAVVDWIYKMCFEADGGNPVSAAFLRVVYPTDEYQNLLGVVYPADEYQNLFGTASGGGANLSGTVFEITPAGKLTRIYSFCAEANCADGAIPNAGLAEGTDGNFYGTTTGGNANCADGESPQTGLVLATNGNFYGTTGNSKCALLNGCGVVFKLTPEGALTTLHSFEGRDGEYPDAGLVQATSGTFYGTTPNGGADGFGTIYSLSTGLGPFVASVPTSALEGATINILGQDFTSASKVKFGDLEASDVKLNGATDLIATVPKGALTGAITVTTGSTTLTSNFAFGVVPDVSSFSPTSGAVGKSVTITGTGLMQTVAVYFDGVQATEFKVISDTEVTATLPTGATTGPISVEAQGGTGFSSTDFTVN